MPGFMLGGDPEVLVAGGFPLSMFPDLRFVPCAFCDRQTTVAGDAWDTVQMMGLRVVCLWCVCRAKGIPIPAGANAGSQ